MRIPLLSFLLLATSSFAQIQMLDSGSHASFRGISVVNDKVAWVSGTNGTILRTVDGGAHWTQCAVPPDGEKLDFRGIVASNESEALAMSSGPGEASRLYHTTDACQSWREVARNQEKDGFWDALLSAKDEGAAVFGDPVGGTFDVEMVPGAALKPMSKVTGTLPTKGCEALAGEGAFAASNSCALEIHGDAVLIGTGGTSGARVLRWAGPGKCAATSVPMGGAAASAGVFSLAMRDEQHIVAVGGDYQKPNESAGTAAFSSDGGHTWTAAAKMPHGYRSAVAWDAKDHVWIAVGTNGSDISRDDGKTWEALENGNWNAVVPPFVAGPDGRIGKIALAK